MAGFATETELNGGPGLDSSENFPFFENDIVILKGADGNPRVTATLDPNLSGAAKLVINDSKTEKKYEIVLAGPYSDPAVYERAELDWSELQKKVKDLPALPAFLALEEVLNAIATAPGHTPIPSPAVIHGKNSKFQKIDEILRGIPGPSPIVGTVSSTSVGALLSGTEVYEIDMTSTVSPRASTEWGKMLVTVENGEIYLTLQSSGAAKPADRNNTDPTSIKFNLGQDLGITDELFAKRMSSIVEAFVNPAGTPGNLFAKSEVIDAILKDSAVAIQSIDNAILKDVKWFNVQLAPGAQLKDVDIIKSTLGLVGDATYSGVKTDNSILTILGSKSKFRNCVFDGNTQVGGNLRFGEAENCHIHGDWSNAIMNDFKFVDLKKDKPAEILKFLHDMDFSWVNGPKLLQQRGIAIQRNLPEDIEFKKKSNEHDLLKNSEIFELLQLAINLNTPTHLQQGQFAKHACSDGTIRGPGLVTSMVNKYNEVGKLYLNDMPMAIPSPVSVNACGHLVVSRADGEPVRLAEISHLALLVHSLYFMNSEHYKAEDGHQGTGRVKKSGQADIDEEAEELRVKKAAAEKKLAEEKAKLEKAAAEAEAKNMSENGTA